MVPKRTNEALDSMPEQNGKRHKPEEVRHGHGCSTTPLKKTSMLAVRLPGQQWLKRCLH